MSTDRAHSLVDAIFGDFDAEAARSVEILNAHAAALAWVWETSGRYPAPEQVKLRLQQAADELRSEKDERDPRTVLIHVAALVLAENHSSAA